MSNDLLDNPLFKGLHIQKVPSRSAGPYMEHLMMTTETLTEIVRRACAEHEMNFIIRQPVDERTIRRNAVDKERDRISAEILDQCGDLGRPGQFIMRIVEGESAASLVNLPSWQDPEAMAYFLSKEGRVAALAKSHPSALVRGLAHLALKLTKESS